MRFAVIGDLHGNLTATEAVLSDIEALESAVDVVICTGDIVGRAARPNEVIDRLRKSKVDAVRGNYDEVVCGLRSESGVDFATPKEATVDRLAVQWTKQTTTQENVDYLRGLPPQARVLVTAGGKTSVQRVKEDAATKEFRRNFLFGTLFGAAAAPRKALGKQIRQVLVVHGSPRDTVESLNKGTGNAILRTIADHAEADVILFGHSREAFQRSLGDVVFIGAGTVASGPPGHSEYAVVEVVGPELDLEFRSVEYDAESEAIAIERSGLPGELADELRHGADIAGSNGI